GIAIGEFGSILQTHDGGDTWVSTPANGKELPSAAAANGTDWWVGSAFGGLWVSRDDGASVLRQSVPAGVLRAIAFTNSHQIGCAVGDAGLVIGTTDGGASWNELKRAPADLLAVAIDGAGIRVMTTGKQGLIWTSLDGGAHWEAQASGTAVN